MDDTTSNPARPSTGSSSTFDWARARDILISVIAAGIILYAVALILRHFAQTVLDFIIASFIAFALVPAVNALVGRRVPRPLAIAIVYIGLLILVVLGGIWIGGQLVSQLTVLAAQVPEYTQYLIGASGHLQPYLSAHGIHVDLQQQLSSLTAGLQNTAMGLLGQSLHIVSGLTTAIISIVLVIFFSIYLVADSRLIAMNVPRLVPRRYRRAVVFIQTTVSDKVGGFIRGQIIMALIVAVTTGLVATILQMKFSLVLGVLAFFFELIPTIGPIMIGLSLAIVAVFQSFVLLFEVLAFYIILNVIESNVLGPRVVGQAVGLPPFVSLIAIVAGAEAGGILGALFAVPATALVVTLVGTVLADWRSGALQDGSSSLAAPSLDGANSEVAKVAADPATPKR